VLGTSSAPFRTLVIKLGVKYSMPSGVGCVAALLAQFSSLGGIEYSMLSLVACIAAFLAPFPR
jgi:hypothetical protein